MNNNWATKYYGSGGSVYIGNPPHNCTLYAAWMLAKNGAPNPGQTWGDAKDWGHTLASITNGTPAIGAIAWYDAGRSGVGSYGHVGYVAQVNFSNGTVFIESDNYMGGSAGYTSSGWIPVSSPSGYIRVKDLGVGDAGAKFVGNWSASDFNGDGMDDIAWHQGSTLYLLHGLGNGTFGIDGSSGGIGTPDWSGSGIDDTTGQPEVYWHQGSTIYVLRWAGSSWTIAGSTGGIGTPDAAVSKAA
jgi:surface antigen